MVKNKTYVIADIHGCYDELMVLMNEVLSLVKEEDKIIFTGDFCDRNNYTYEVLNYLMKLSERKNVICLMGNHEEMFLNAYNGIDEYVFLQNGGKQTLYSLAKNDAFLNDNIYTEKFMKIIDWIYNLPKYYEDENYIFVHGGLVDDITSLEEMSNFKYQDNENYTEILWNRNTLRPNKRNKILVFGHTPLDENNKYRTEVFFDKKRNKIWCDCGSAFINEGGKLSCVILPDNKVIYSERILKNV